MLSLHYITFLHYLQPVGSPSPVFPEERSIHQADSQAASSNHVTAASPDTTVSNCRSRKQQQNFNLIFVTFLYKGWVGS